MRDSARRRGRGVSGADLEIQTMYQIWRVLCSRSGKGLPGIVGATFRYRSVEWLVLWTISERGTRVQYPLSQFGGSVGGASVCPVDEITRAGDESVEGESDG